MRLGSLVCGLLLSIIYLMDFLCITRGLESRPCREILYIIIWIRVFYWELKHSY
jgi:hypothetical protein